MSNKNFEITICSHPDKENLVAEVSYKKEELKEVSAVSYEAGKLKEVSTQTNPVYVVWAEISAETPHEYMVCFGNPNEFNILEFPYDEAMEVLAEAKERLSKYQRTPEEQAEYDADQKAMENWKPTPEETAEYERKMKEQREKYYG